MIARRTLLGAGATFALPSAAFAKGDPIATGRTGRWHGRRDGVVAAFLGIRYGNDTSHHRFRPATVPPPSREPQQATRFGPSCPQSSRIADQREDCLFLNVWTPAANPNARRPVMVYFHGGAYSNGTVIEPQVFGATLAEKGDVVVVTVNHRLNALGYLYLARLDPRFPDSGNLGQLDLILALQWVRDNIIGFGGDPNRVMVFGQSGGGAKIATLMGMPAAKGLFHRAATMSGQQVTASGPLNATARAKALLAKLNATPADLIGMPVQRLIEGLAAEDPVLGGGVYMGPVLDMKWLTRHPFWPDANPQGNAIPLILGNTRDETRAFIDPKSESVRTLDWSNLAERIAPQLRIDAHPEWVVAEYRKQFPDWSAQDIFYAATTAGRSWRGQVIEAEERAKAGVPAWVYQLDFQSPVAPERGAAHTHDIPLVFGTIGAEGTVSGTGPGAQAVSAAMQRAFVNLAATGNPNGAGVHDWPKHSLPDRATMLFDTHSRVENDPRKWQRELFARIPYIQPGT
ncbi:carboxylesterase/lipase family protein [Sphingomonas sp. J315]|uniref:carboxylesterase/lipase family protein n=1 Tax=Sphingomonas sp. J315 TaxID=2898433 RepID=UPI0021AD698A|nr:carboxylesterase/lipase family protein [Sphingomonas sp. J315]UUY00628.1 carboxylesterase/lipase family protein [Sphingomonas sp. J315]